MLGRCYDLPGTKEKIIRLLKYGNVKLVDTAEIRDDVYITDIKEENIDKYPYLRLNVGDLRWWSVLTNRPLTDIPNIISEFEFLSPPSFIVSHTTEGHVWCFWLMPAVIERWQTGELIDWILLQKELCRLLGGASPEVNGELPVDIVPNPFYADRPKKIHYYGHDRKWYRYHSEYIREVEELDDV